MIILHNAKVNDKLYLWAERSLEKDAKPSTRKVTKTKISKAITYPYGMGINELARLLKESSIGTRPAVKRTQKVVAWLPTKGDAPIPSSTLIAEPSEPKAKVELVPWSINAYPLSSEESLELLCLCMGKQTLAAGVVVGADLAYWAGALRFVGSLVARQQFLPGLEVNGSQYLAQWQPVFAGDDVKRVAKLAKQMPPIARAVTDSKADVPPEKPAELILKQFITQAIDYLVRTGYATDVVSGKKVVRKRPLFESVHDAWLYALRSCTGIIDYDKAEVARLAQQIQQWRRPIAISTASPIRLCFRLEEPKETEEKPKKRDKTATETWHVRFLLQPHNDQSLLIPVEDVWETKGRKASVLKRLGGNVQECLLSSLGQAAGICPNIAASLKTAQPAGYNLDTVNAHQFLTEKAISLEQAGFGVMLPAWWTRKGTKMRLTTRANVKSPKMQGGGGLSLGEIVQFDWEIALGNKKLSLAELQALAKLKAPLVKVRGQWVHMNTEEIQAAIDFWKKKGSQQGTVQDVIQIALGARDAGGGFDFEGVKATGWVGKLLKQLDGSGAFEQIDPPDAFCGTLRPYQERGYSWLAFLRQWGLGACLADDMGLGKTIQTLVLIQRDWATNGKRPVLLACPNSVVNNWKKEADRTAVAAPAAGKDSMIVQHVENNRCQYQGRWLRYASGCRSGTHKAGKGARFTIASDKSM